eukprot:6529902-Prymnesium_polylepis.3
MPPPPPPPPPDERPPEVGRPMLRSHASLSMAKGARERGERTLAASLSTQTVSQRWQDTWPYHRIRVAPISHTHTHCACVCHAYLTRHTTTTKGLATSAQAVARTTPHSSRHMTVSVGHVQSIVHAGCGPSLLPATTTPHHLAGQTPSPFLHAISIPSFVA